MKELLGRLGKTKAVCQYLANVIIPIINHTVELRGQGSGEGMGVLYFLCLAFPVLGTGGISHPCPRHLQKEADESSQGYLLSPRCPPRYRMTRLLCSSRPPPQHSWAHMAGTGSPPARGLPGAMRAQDRPQQEVARLDAAASFPTPRTNCIYPCLGRFLKFPQVTETAQPQPCRDKPQ